MWDLLSKPITEKHTSTFETSHVRVGCCGMQGWRKTMEDAHIAQLNVDGNKKQAFFGVFDGHNGHKIAKYCGAHLLEELLSTPQFQKGDYKEALEEAFGTIDKKLCSIPEYRNEGGAAAVSVLVANGTLFCACAGDSRAVLCRDGKGVALSVDHKPTQPAERMRIEKAGGCVEDGRVNSVLALSRAIGDFDFKDNAELSWREQMITAFPDVTCTPLTPRDEFIVLACDGVWDMLANDQCCSLIAQGLKETNDDVGLVCEMILDKCLAQCPSTLGCDNTAIIIVQFKPMFFSDQ